MYRQTSNSKERICIECGTKFSHHIKRKCKDCRIKKVKIPRSWEDGLNILNKTKNIRDRLVVHLQLYQALREGEILGSDTKEHGSLKPLTLSQIDLSNNKIIIYGKGGTVEYVFMDKELINLLNQYLKHKRIGQDKPLIRLSCRQYQNIVKVAAFEAGIENPERFSPHVLRAISITRMLRKKGLSFAKKHARHKSSMTTLIYDVSSTEESRADFNSVFEDT